MRVAASATKHCISAEEGINVASFPTWVAPLGDDPAQWRELRLGFDTHARFLETIVVVASNGDELLIHAMKARSKRVDLLTWRGGGGVVYGCSPCHVRCRARRPGAGVENKLNAPMTRRIYR